MLENLKQALYAGVGMVYMTAEKAREVGEKLAKEAGASEQEGRKLVDEMLKKSGEARAEIEALVRKKIDIALESLKVPSGKDVEELKRRIDALEKELAAKS